MRFQLLCPEESQTAEAHDRISESWLTPETPLVRRLAQLAKFDDPSRIAIEQRAADWIRQVREQPSGLLPVDAFMREYDLSTEEGVLLMCLAEALLRIPDKATAERLIEDKLGHGTWEQHLGRSPSLMVNASTWSLMLGGRLLQASALQRKNALEGLRSIAARAGETVVRIALRHAMQVMANHFVFGRSIEEAIQYAARSARPGAYSFDMLGEAALTAEDARIYLDRYLHAIDQIGAAELGQGKARGSQPGLSIKLSALHPRYEYRQMQRLVNELAPRLLRLAVAARKANIDLTIDAEESERLAPSLAVFDRVLSEPTMRGWSGLGIAVQAFSRRALPVLDWLHQRAEQLDRQIPVRLVKGAYWDREIKQAQIEGLASFPVFTRKAHTDISYLACARRLLADRRRFYPMMATHNAHTLSAILQLAGDTQAFELQRLHGMGESLHEQVMQATGLVNRVYAPVGAHADLLPYLVRRLLENGANTSFVHRLQDDKLSADALVRDPAAELGECRSGIEDPTALFQPERQNSPGLLLASPYLRKQLAAQIEQASPLRGLKPVSLTAVDAPGARLDVVNPADWHDKLATLEAFDPSGLDAVFEQAWQSHLAWSQISVEDRASVLDRAADALWEDRAAFLHLLVREAGKPLPAALAELREAIDFLRYYAVQARACMPRRTLGGPSGENNSIVLQGRGVWACISPWNFPLAIFTGQIAAALVTGNSVIAKPAEQTPLIALRMSRLMQRAGIPAAALHCLVGGGALGESLVTGQPLAGVAFTGSLPVAKQIRRRLAARDGPIVPLIAETGGQNVMIADSSAQPEQLAKDVIESAFGSAGQRCSALRVLYLQQECFDANLAMLRGAMRELIIGNPACLETDVGPVIDEAARRSLEAHVETLRSKGQLIEQCALPNACRRGHFVAPAIAQIPGIEALSQEHFGPILHLASVRSEQLETLIDRVNAAGHGLTLGLHTRIESRWEQLSQRARVGNVYVNRGMTGAVVGSQPFGGEGLSGTGPKAGGPHYLLRFVTERSLSVNTSAMGGDPELLASRRENQSEP